MKNVRIQGETGWKMVDVDESKILVKSFMNLYVNSWKTQLCLILGMDQFGMNFRHSFAKQSSEVRKVIFCFWVFDIRPAFLIKPDPTSPLPSPAPGPQRLGNQHVGKQHAYILYSVI